MAWETSCYARKIHLVTQVNLITKNFKWKVVIFTMVVAQLVERLHMSSEIGVQIQLILLHGQLR